MRSIVTAAVLALSAGLVGAQSLQSRDLNGDGTADAYYDSAQNISWLADANYYATLGNPPGTNWMGYPMAPGQLSFVDAINWVSVLTVHGVSSWRLPNRLVPNGGDDPMCNEVSCNPVSMWPTELGGLSSILGGTPGPFMNMQGGYYMTSTTGGWLEYRNPVTGGADITNETSLFFSYVLPVHDGDIGAPVSPVPEPGTYLLMLAGLVGVWSATRPRTRGA